MNSLKILSKQRLFLSFRGLYKKIVKDCVCFGHRRAPRQCDNSGMFWRSAATLLIVLATALQAGKKELDPGHAANALIDIQATAIVDRQAIKGELGSDFDGQFTLVRITVTPKGDHPLWVRLDDFLLRSEKDGARSTPFAPSQIAGQGGLVLHEVKIGRSGPLGDSGGPIWGGMPGTGAQPQQIPMGGGSAGNGAGGTATEARMDNGGKQKVDPMLATLKAKVLPEKETAQPVSGLLYFPLEKQRPKDLELDYSGPAGPLKIRFR